jgi:hypothetical protein
VPPLTGQCQWTAAYRGVQAALLFVAAPDYTRRRRGPRRELAVADRGEHRQAAGAISV